LDSVVLRLWCIIYLNFKFLMTVITYICVMVMNMCHMVTFLTIVKLNHINETNFIQSKCV